MSWQMAGYSSFSWPNDIHIYLHFLYPVIHRWALRLFSMFWLLWIMPQWTLGCGCLFKIPFSSEMLILSSWLHRGSTQSLFYSPSLLRHRDVQCPALRLHSRCWAALRLCLGFLKLLPEPPGSKANSWPQRPNLTSAFGWLNHNSWQGPFSKCMSKNSFSIKREKPNSNWL